MPPAIPAPNSLPLINAFAAVVTGRVVMGVCDWCGTSFPLTRSTRKYCTTRCKTNACLGRKPSRIRAADVEALHELLHTDLPSAESFRERLRAIIAPHLPPIMAEGAGSVPRMD